MKKTNTKWNVGLTALCLITIGLCMPDARSEETNQHDAVTSITGSGEPYKTTIERKTSNTLSAEDFRQVSMLGSRILVHINNATKHFEDKNAESARMELEHAKTLADIIRDMLPVTVVRTQVNDAEGREIYSYEERLQNDRIPLFEGLIAVEVVQPIIEAKRNEAAIKGLEMADTEFIHTAVLLDLAYVERNVKRALDQAEDADQALAALARAQANGVDFRAHAKDHPLLAAQAALRLSEEQVRSEKYEAAWLNLQKAHIQLQAYRELVGERAAKTVRTLEEDIGVLKGKLREVGAADKIRGFWNRAASWFKSEPNQAEQTDRKNE